MEERDPAFGYKFWQMFCTPELIVPKAAVGAAKGAAILAMVGVGAYPTIDAAFKMLPQDSNTVQAQAFPVYSAAYKRYKVLYEVLKAVR